MVLLADVTESHLMQVFLTRQQRLLTLGELAAGLAHQIRTPLAAALLYASQMTLPGRSTEDLARCAERTVGSLKQLDKLVNDMLAFAHGGAAREVVSVSALLEQVAQWLRPALRRGIRLTIRTQAPDLTVRANAPSLVSAVLNLATNALQAATADLDLELLARRTRGRPGADRGERQRSRRAGAHSRADFRALLHHPGARQRHRSRHRQVRGRGAPRQRVPGGKRRRGHVRIARAPRSSSIYRQRKVHEQGERIGSGGRRRRRAARGIGRHAARRRICRRLRPPTRPAPCSCCRARRSPW